MSSEATSKKVKNILLAEHAGFCYGVKRAVETTKRLKLDNPQEEVSVLGELIHNEQVILELEKLGIKQINDVDSAEKDCGVCVIRSHGVPTVVYEKLESKGFKIADLTCPDVKKVQQKALELVKDGYLLIIVGKSEHPEVVAIKANAEACSEDVFVVSNVESLKIIEEKIKTHKKIGIVVQTTQRKEVLQEIVSYILPLSSEIKVFNTICASTTLRQNDARELAKKSDLMVVVGSKNSANTSHLAQILQDITTTIHVEKADELTMFANEINNASNIGVTAGASAPDYLIKEILNELKKY